MGKEDNGYGSWRDGDEPKTDVHADKKTGSNQPSLCNSLEISNSPDDNSLQLQSAVLDDNAVNADDDGVKIGHEGRSENDEEGHLAYHIGLVMKERYEVVVTLGAGAFGKVVECIDRDKEERVAVKIVRNMDCFREVARSEIAVLEEINSLDEDNTFACVRMLDWFEHEGHICIVFELLGLSTFEFLRQNRFLPFNVEQIRHMAFQIFRAVCFLHRNQLTHTDLKPENILFVCSDYDLQHNRETKRKERKLRSLDVKVVDFGTATFDHGHHESLVSTRHYRAPEVILDLGWNQSCDVWSLGCVLMEFYLGCTLFPTHDTKEHLAMMEKILGPIPPHLLKQTRKQHYVHNERLNWDEQSSSDDYIGKHCKPLKQYMLRKSEEERQLFDLLGCMLEYDVCRRITLEEALWHPFFSPLRTAKQRS
ncbi:dual specificity protein kinase CLK1-like isoform X1 [Sebastes umbrosus]|uniref:dual specificity protein kinase CLK1-like isoform X1 n=1 Tax=Sebastes umbrosus TaxID=72105 RepID=UPI00189F4C2A|nr:dual specificity protein kinase CLK1-like isoform X1 [Sebastes umbrosus]XP_037603590.1 dual specificity protein kinase CLK1-like isoform X1 [Sebastes umbrosus]XP_037603591.1 dual specificity protein kinase CLK1-like isoform X1 [Sebastes umbrosus]